MQNTKLLEINLRLFDGAAAGAAAPAGAEGSSRVDNSALPKADTHRPGSSRRGKTGEFDNVVFGKQAEATAAADDTSAAGKTTSEGNANKSGVSTTSDTLEAKRQAFKDLVEGEYKDQYTEMFQNAFNRRFKEAKGMENTINAQKPIMDMLMQRYNIGDGDLTKLQTAIEQDDIYWEDAAEKAGLTVEQYKAMQKLERENAEMKRLRQRQLNEEQANKQLAAWYQEAEQVKSIYPTFDFQREVADQNFRGLLKSGISVQKAYELMHMEEIKEATAAAAAKTASQQMVARVQSQAARPSENGMSSQSAVIVKNSVHDLSKAERAEIARRVQRGDKITF